MAILFLVNVFLEVTDWICEYILVRDYNVYGLYESLCGYERSGWPIVQTFLEDLDKSQLFLVTGAGGFLGGHLVRRLLAAGFRQVRCVDIKPVAEWFQYFPADLFPAVDTIVADLRESEACARAMDGAVYVVNLACDMGGMGFIENNRAACMLSVLINTHLLDQARRNGKVRRYLYASSACIYPAFRQDRTDGAALRESDAYPAMPEDGYGWEKLFSERLCRHAWEDWGIETRMARLHNVYGPNGSFDGGREKAPAAICRKIIAAKLSGHHEIEIWGDGEQTRSFMFIDDCLQGFSRLLTSEVREPLNIGSDQLVSINHLVSLVEAIAGITVRRHYDLTAPVGVRGRNSDNTLIRQLFDWAPSTRLEEGLERTYAWIWDRMASGQDLGVGAGSASLRSGLAAR